MAVLPKFQFTNQEDWRWKIPFLDENGGPLKLHDKDGQPRSFIVEIAKTGSGRTPIKTLRAGSGIEFQDDDATLSFKLDRSETKDLEAGEYTADVLELLDGDARSLFVPVRVIFGEPIAVVEYLRRGIGVSLSPNRQPVTTPVALPGPQGERGRGFITSSRAPTPADGENGDYWILQRPAQASLLYGPKAAGAWPADPSSALGVGGIADVAGLPAALELIPPTVRNYGAIADGASHPVSQWIVPAARGRFLTFQALQAAYPHVAALTDEIDWTAAQAMANARRHVVLCPGTLILNRDLVLPIGANASVVGPGSVAAELRFTGGTKGVAFEGAGANDLLLLQGYGVSTSQFGVGRAWTVSYADTAASTQQAVFRDVVPRSVGGAFEAMSELRNVRSPLYDGVFSTGSLATKAHHRYRGTTTDIRHIGGMCLSGIASHDMGDLCEGLVLDAHIIIDCDYGVNTDFAIGKPWVQITGGQISCYKSIVKAQNLKQLIFTSGVHYAANYKPERMTGYIGFDLGGTDTRNVIISNAYFQADGYTGAYKTLLKATHGIGGVAVGNQVSGFDIAWSLGAETRYWQVRGNQYLNVDTPWTDAGAANAHEFLNTTGSGRTMYGAGDFVDEVSGASSVTFRLRDRGGPVNSRAVGFLMDDGVLRVRLQNDDGSTKAVLLTGTSGGVHFGGDTSGSSSFTAGMGLAGACFISDGTGKKQIQFGAPDSAGAGFRTLRVPN